MKLKAQSILEYVVVLGVVGMALGTMGLYFRRGIQAVIKVAADEVGIQEDAEDDPLKGTKTKPESSITTATTGPESLWVYDNAYRGGGQHRLWDTTQTARGWATYTTEREE